MSRRIVYALICLILNLLCGSTQAQHLATTLDVEGGFKLTSDTRLVFRLLKSNVKPLVYENWTYSRHLECQKIEIRYSVGSSEFSESYTLQKNFRNSKA